MNTQNTLLLCECRFADDGHATFNAAFLQTIALAYSKTKIVFIAQIGHIEAVKRVFITTQTQVASNIEWQPVVFDTRIRKSLFGISVHDTVVVKRIFELITQYQPMGVFWMASSPGALFLYKGFNRLKYSVPSFALMHGELVNALTSTTKGKVDYGRALRSFNSGRIHHIVLGHHITKAIGQEYPKITDCFFSLTFPYLFGNLVPSNVPTDKIRLGLLGTAATHTGLEKFLWLVDHAQSLLNVEFELIGCLGHLESPLSARNLELAEQSKLAKEPLPLSQYFKRIADLTYGIGLANPARLRFAGSQSFLDGLSQGKPGIYLRNDLIVEANKRIGDIGLICDTLEAVAETVRQVALQFPSSLYKTQVQNILQGRSLYAPEMLSIEYQRTINEHLAL